MLQFIYRSVQGDRQTPFL